MTENQKQILEQLNFGKISIDEFITKFGVNILENPEYVIAEISEAIKKNDLEELDLTITLIWESGKPEKYIDLLNELLLNPNHRSHQRITKTIQKIGNPSSIPFIRKVLKSNFDYLKYTCSESGVIAKWFSWALYSIGTKEAIDLIKEYSNSEDEGIKNEMIYRLNKTKK